LIQANLDSGSLGSAVHAIRTTLEEQLQLPAEFSFEITGQNEVDLADTSRKICKDSSVSAKGYRVADYSTQKHH
jgi:putative lipoic acid-binding regulatory protein